MNFNKYDLFNMLVAKARNVIYYRSIDTRDRSASSYFHITRLLRSDAKNLTNLFTEENERNSKEFSFLLDLIRSIDPKIKSEDCDEFINTTLKNLLTKFGYE